MSDVQARVANLLAAHMPLGFRCECGWDSHQSATYATEHADHVAAALAEAGLLVERADHLWQSRDKARGERDAARAELAEVAKQRDEAKYELQFARSATKAKAKRAEKAEAQREKLARWKGEALPVLDGLQELGKALGLPLGVRITGPMALEAVETIQAELNHLRGVRAMVQRDREALEALHEQAERKYADLVAAVTRHACKGGTCSSSYWDSREDETCELHALIGGAS